MAGNAEIIRFKSNIRLAEIAREGLIAARQKGLVPEDAARNVDEIIVTIAGTLDFIDGGNRSEEGVVIVDLTRSPVPASTV